MADEVTLPPTPMPGAKHSSDTANKPFVGEQTGNDSNANRAAAVHDVTKALPLAEHLRAILGTDVSKQPEKEFMAAPGKGVMQAVNEAVEGVKASPTPDMDH
jgi:hypothetical protein